MKNPKGSAAVWVIVSLVIVIVAGAAYWYWSQNSMQPTTSATTETTQQDTTATVPTQQNSNATNQTVSNPPAQPSSAAPSATIDQTTLATNSSTPTITGMVANTSSICVVLLNTKAGKLLANYNSYSNKWSLCTDTQAPEGGDSGITISNGHWSMSTAFNRGTTFGNGNYGVGVYNESTGQLLTAGTLVVSGVSEQ
jgi:hypothetical protein